MMSTLDPRWRYVRVKVEPGMFSSERYVSFQVEDKAYGLFVDEKDVAGDMMPVYLVAQQGDQAIIQLPRDTFTTGNRIQVPTSILQPGEGSR
jgi:hypothetical protein